MSVLSGPPADLHARLNPDEESALEHLFTYHAPGPEAIENMRLIRETAKVLARLILATCPRSADRTAAIRKVREGIMIANASIVLGGKNLP